MTALRKRSSRDILAHQLGELQRLLKEPCSPSEANKAVAAILGRYPMAPKAPDLEAYLDGLALILMDYPRSIALAADHPKSGVPGHYGFPPTPKELREWCEKALYKLRCDEATIITELGALDRPRPSLPEPEPDTPAVSLAGSRQELHEFCERGGLGWKPTGGPSPTPSQGELAARATREARQVIEGAIAAALAPGHRGFMALLAHPEERIEPLMARCLAGEITPAEAAAELRAPEERKP